MRISKVALWLLVCLLGITVRPVSAQVTIPVNSPAFAFSPGNWTGDAGRGGSVYRQTWYPGAYFRVAWTTTSTSPTATLLLDTSPYGTVVPNKPNLTYNVDGVWTDNVPCSSNIILAGLSGAGPHILTVYLRNSDQSNRWGTLGVSGANVVRVIGLQIDAGGTPGVAARQPRWALEVGDSITEGSAANFGNSDALADYSYFVGQALQTRGFEYGVSACGWSGWLARGDRPADVPAYYAVSSGSYSDAGSRWDKIDANTSLLDSRGHLSAYGGVGQEPAIITINYGTNDGLGHANASDTQASVTGSLASLRRAAPSAKIFVIVPFGQYDVDVLKAGVHGYLAAHPTDHNVALIDLGASVARTLAANGYWSGLHPNMRGHAALAAQILVQMETKVQVAVHTELK